MTLSSRFAKARSRTRPAADARTRDITLSFAVWLNRARHSRWLPLLHKQWRLCKVRIWDIGESGGFHQHHESEVETWAYESHTHPASRRDSFTYFDEARLPLHRPNGFTDTAASYPLRHTVAIRTCTTCQGSGKVRCSMCFGSGETRTGEKRSTCFSCGGRGRVSCGRCRGEGRVVQFTSKDYRWRHHVDREPILLQNMNRGRVRRLVDESLQNGGAFPITGFSVDSVAATSGVLNSRIQDAVQHALDREQAMREKITARGLILRHEIARHYVPIGFVNVSLGTRYGQYFIAGSLKGQAESGPPIGLSGWKLATWLSFLGVVLLGLFAWLERTPLEPYHAGLLSVPMLSLAGLLWTRFRRGDMKRPPNWLIFDDGGDSGWLFCYLFLQSLSRRREGYVDDPFYTRLLGPQGDQTMQRNSFMCSLRRHGGDGAVQIIYFGTQVTSQFGEFLDPLMQETRRLTWVAREAEAEPIDVALAERLALLPALERDRFDVWIVLPPESGLAAADFPRVAELLQPDCLILIELPLDRMYLESRSGTLSETSRRYFERVAELDPWLAEPHPRKS